MRHLLREVSVGQPLATNGKQGQSRPCGRSFSRTEKHPLSSRNPFFSVHGGAQRGGVPCMCVATRIGRRIGAAASTMPRAKEGESARVVCSRECFIRVGVSVRTRTCASSEERTHRKRLELRAKTQEQKQKKMSAYPPGDFFLLLFFFLQCGVRGQGEAPGLRRREQAAREGEAPNAGFVVGVVLRRATPRG